MTSLLRKHTMEERAGLVTELQEMRLMKLRILADRRMNDESKQRIVADIDDIISRLVKRLVRR